ncbi:hypothetical protein BC940DRAFT_354063 [Gongronella butleri]|nr:hypothetical protein BC940DRAFT_354063 [Gongronella butleri]
MFYAEEPDDFCRAAFIIERFLLILSASLLTLIGINLVLTYVFRVQARAKFDWYYFPAAIFYSILGCVGPAIHVGHLFGVPDNVSVRRSCWYKTAIYERGDQDISWMWFYSFVFADTIISASCSAVAIVQLLRDQSRIRESTHESELVQNKSAIISCVVLRCAMYTFVPFVSNFCGFVLQCIATVPGGYPQYSIVLADVIVSGLQGVFVSLIFATDPAVVGLVKRWVDRLYHLYVLEFVMVEEQPNEYIKPLPDAEASEAVSPDDCSFITILVSFLPDAHDDMAQAPWYTCAGLLYRWRMHWGPTVCCCIYGTPMEQPGQVLRRAHSVYSNHSNSPRLSTNDSIGRDHDLEMNIISDFLAPPARRSMSNPIVTSPRTSTPISHGDDTSIIASADEQQQSPAGEPENEESEENNVVPISPPGLFQVQTSPAHGLSPTSNLSGAKSNGSSKLVYTPMRRLKLATHVTDRYLDKGAFTARLLLYRPFCGDSIAEEEINGYYITENDDEHDFIFIP